MLRTFITPAPARPRAPLPTRPDGTAPAAMRLRPAPTPLRGRSLLRGRGAAACARPPASCARASTRPLRSPDNASISARIRPQDRASVPAPRPGSSRHRLTGPPPGGLHFGQRPASRQRQPPPEPCCSVQRIRHPRGLPPSMRGHRPAHRAYGLGCKNAVAGYAVAVAGYATTAGRGEDAPCVCRATRRGVARPPHPASAA